MWIAKIMRVYEEELKVICFIDDENLKTVYEVALSECKNQECALAGIYEGMTLEEVNNDDTTKVRTKALYQICKSELGEVLVYGKNHQKKICVIRKDKVV